MGVWIFHFLNTLTNALDSIGKIVRYMSDKEQIYRHEVDELKKSRRIQSLVPGFCGNKIYVSGNLGMHCAPILILFQWDIRGQSLYIYDVIDNSGSSFSVCIQKAVQWCEKNGCELSTIFLPHDGEKEQLGYNKVPSLDTDLIDEEFDIITLLYEQKLDGINRCRRLFPNIYFNNTDSVAGLIRSLGLYSYVHMYDERSAKILTSTKADVHSDFCDAFRYVCSSAEYIRDLPAKKKEEEMLAWWRDQFTTTSCWSERKLYK